MIDKIVICLLFVSYWHKKRAKLHNKSDICNIKCHFNTSQKTIYLHNYAKYCTFAMLFFETYTV